MQVKMTFRSCENSELLEKHIRQQLKKIEEFVSHELSPITIEFSVTMHPTHGHHEVNARVYTPHFHCKAEREGKDVYAEINEVCDKVYRQLCDRKEHLIDRRNHGCGGECRAEVWKEIEAFDGDAFENYEKIEEEANLDSLKEKK